jgi:hypothetical protein
MINELAARCNCDKYTRFRILKTLHLKALKYLYALISRHYAAAIARAPAIPPWRQGYESDETAKRMNLASTFSRRFASGRAPAVFLPGAGGYCRRHRRGRNRPLRGACPCRKLKFEHIDGVARPRSATNARALFGTHRVEPAPRTLNKMRLGSNAGRSQSGIQSTLRRMNAASVRPFA